MTRSIAPIAAGDVGAGREPRREALRLLGIFAAWRLLAYGYTLAVGYAVFALYGWWLGVWLVNKEGVPLYHDFTCAFVAGLQALHGKIASIYVPAEFIRAQEALVGTGHVLFSNWPYPPTYFLILAPLATLPYVAAFLIWGVLTLFGYVTVVYLIVRRPPALLYRRLAVWHWNFIAGQSGL
jgi:hypothetical protein